MDWEHWNVATVVLVAITLGAIVIGGVVVIAGNMTFDEYLDTMWKFAAALGLLAIGRGIKSRNGTGRK